jgi:hypothetical protein
MALLVQLILYLVLSSNNALCVLPPNVGVLLQSYESVPILPFLFRLVS